MDVDSFYQSKLTTPDQAVASIPAGSKLSMGMAMAEPPALLKALADGPRPAVSRSSRSTTSSPIASLETPFFAMN